MKIRIFYLVLICFGDGLAYCSRQFQYYQTDVGFAICIPKIYYAHHTSSSPCQMGPMGSGCYDEMARTIVSSSFHFYF